MTNYIHTTEFRQVFDFIKLKYRLSLDDLQEKNKHLRIAEARQLTCYLLHEYARLTYVQISKTLSRGSSSVHYNVSTMIDRMTYDKRLKQFINDFSKFIDVK